MTDLCPICLEPVHARHELPLCRENLRKQGAQRMQMAAILECQSLSDQNRIRHLNAAEAIKG